jgi:hypothetical protein
MVKTSVIHHKIQWLFFVPISVAPPRRAGWLKILSFRLLLLGYMFRISFMAQLFMRDNIYDFPHPLNFDCVNWPLGGDSSALCRPLNHPLPAAVHRGSSSARKVTIQQRSSVLGISYNFNPRAIKGLNSAKTTSTSFPIHYQRDIRSYIIWVTDSVLQWTIYVFRSNPFPPTHYRLLLPLIT